jgi:hypothetical protein
VRAGVTEVLTLEINFRAPQCLAKAFGIIQGCRATDILGQVVTKLLAERGILPSPRVLMLTLLKRRYEGFRDKYPAVVAKMA